MEIRVCGQDVRLTSHLDLVPILNMTGAIPPYPLYAFIACTGTALPFFGLLRLVGIELVCSDEPMASSCH